MVLEGLTKYVTDYIQYELDKYSKESKIIQMKGIRIIEGDILVTLEKVYELFITFSTAWSGTYNIVNTDVKELTLK